MSAEGDTEKKTEGGAEEEKTVCTTANLFEKHPEFQIGVQIKENNEISWTQYGYAISSETYKEDIYKIDVEFTEVPAIAWFGVLKCDKYDKGNVHDRARLCVYQSNGFCNQSGFSYGNQPWKSGDVITLEINLTAPRKPETSTSTSPLLASTSTPSSENTSSSSSDTPPEKTTPTDSDSTSPTSSVSDSSSTSTSSSSASSSSEEALKDAPKDAPKDTPKDAAFETPKDNQSFNTIHFFLNGSLQPISYVHVPTPLRFILYCNYGESSCKVREIKRISPQESVDFKSSKQTPYPVGLVHDPDEKGFKERVVEWNPIEKRKDR